MSISGTKFPEIERKTKLRNGGSLEGRTAIVIFRCSRGSRFLLYNRRPVKPLGTIVPVCVAGSVGLPLMRGATPLGGCTEIPGEVCSDLSNCREHRNRSLDLAELLQISIVIYTFQRLILHQTEFCLVQILSEKRNYSPVC